MMEVASGGVSCDQPALCGAATSDEANTGTATIARLDVGATVVVTYTAVVSELVEPGDQILDSGGADVDYTVGSALSAETPDVSTASANGDDSVLNEVLDPSVAIAIGRTSVSHSVGGEVVVEGFVSVRCSVSVPEVTTGLSLAFTLTLGANLEASGVTASLNTSAPVVLVGTGGPSTVGDTTTLDLGTASNADGNGEATVVVEFKFFVTSPAGAGTDIRGETVGVACTLTYTGGTADAPDDVNLVVAEPTLEHTLTATSATTELDAGDEGTFTLVVQHVSGTSDAPAYDVATTIVFEDGIEVVDGSWACTVDACGRFGASVDNGVREFTVTNDRLDESDVLTVTFTAVMAPDASVNPVSDYVLSIQGTAYDSSPKDSGPYTGREYSVGGVMPSETLSTRSGTLTGFVISSTSFADTVPSTTVSAGEGVVFDVVLSVPEGQAGASVTLSWSEGELEYETSEVATVTGALAQNTGDEAVATTEGTEGVDQTGAGGSSGVVFDFGTVDVAGNSNAGGALDDTVTVQVSTSVPVDAADGATIVVSASAVVGGEALTVGDVTLTVARPQLEVTRQLVNGPSGSVEAGEAYLRSVTITHAAGSLAPAFEVSLTEVIDEDLEVASA